MVLFTFRNNSFQSPCAVAEKFVGIFMTSKIKPKRRGLIQKLLFSAILKNKIQDCCHAAGKAKTFVSYLSVTATYMGTTFHRLVSVF